MSTTTLTTTSVELDRWADDGGPAAPERPTQAERTHQFMRDSRQAAEDRRFIESADNVLRSNKFDAATLEGIRWERDMRSARFDQFVNRYGARAIAF